MTLGGALFVWRGVDQDYHFEESIKCLAEFCDEISVVAGGHDGTFQKCAELLPDLGLLYGVGIHLTHISLSEWNFYQGREKLSVFTNKAIDKLSTDYVFALQADEIVTPESYPFIRAAIASGSYEGIMCRRVNFWFSPYHYIHVAEKQPVGTTIMRLAKRQYRAYDDAENLGVQDAVIVGNLDDITILHFGFVRDKVKHMTKIRHIQGEVFQIDVDPKCDGMEVFDPSKWFSRDDVTKYEKPLPPIIQPWVDERYPELKP